MNEEIAEYYEELYNLCAVEQEQPLARRYRQLREALERVMRQQMMGTGLQATDLAARINYVATQFALDGREQNQLHTFRLTSNDILNHRKEPSEQEFLRDLRAVAYAYRKIFHEDIPPKLYTLLPKQETTPAVKREKETRIRRIRVCFDYADESYLYVRPIDVLEEEPVKVNYNKPGVNEEFKDTVEELWRYAQLNLLDVTVDDNGVYTPSFIVLEPDYLLDISSLAECYKDYGSHPANYFLSRLVPIENARPLLLGNIANLFLDEWIYAGEKEPDYTECMKKAFRQYPIELAACEELRNPQKEKEFAQDCRMHFEHIRETVQKTFLQPGYNLDKNDAVLEPSYICEALGIQGRLDYMQRDMSSFIEMKSGKADEYAMQGRLEPKENNRVQMLLYMAVLEYSMGQERRSMHPYLLYTRYPLLYPARASWAQVRRIINLRNCIVASEYGVQLHNHPSFTQRLLAQINPSVLNQKGLQGRFWEQYLKPSISRFGERMEQLTPLERTYFYTLYNFITKELYTSKSGDVNCESRTGASALWLSTLDEKRDAGEILYDLTIVENHASQAHKAFIILSIPQYEETFLPNFRNGDVVVLYERNNGTDNVTNKMVFKGNIESITDNELRIRLRAAQQNPLVFPENSRYAVEHDTMDTTFRSMYLGLSSFMDANPERRELLLGQRPPRFDMAYEDRIARTTDDFERVALKAEAACDYFLLVGPPGTGKTSRALRRMVEHFYACPSTQVLLLAYTNRAVDEICRSLSAILPQVDYIRVGSELSCDARFRKHLLENVLAECNNRREVNIRMADCRIYVGTVASIASKPELFKLKLFDVAIVDEATQILEPQLLGILCARFKDGRNGIGKFILIGDHKQLPAVVLQSNEQSEVHDEGLRRIGLYNLKDSLFERLYRFHLQEEHCRAVDMLCRQGRMHPGVASFPNREFYAGKLEALGLPHQLENVDAPVRFIPSERDTESVSGKTNRNEARIVAQLAADVYHLYKETFEVNRTLGVITPYRSQIALIRKEIQALGISALNEISVDTVERYQGSERDVIIYSFCVNYLYQLKFLPNLTEENGVWIDRKLNVALTRARRQLYITGVPDILSHNLIYRRLIQAIN
ncbi:AAA domain-containing protein [Phocaeicola massiliensis]|uniref:AAA domain-containing protein n=1 Tax=Phocaeicola massiliensis TaxID=204516 RepID=UPI00202F09A4|nr:AAA domain-containing protein [Phocaeicola massiliensis]MCM1615552.1 DEAD/DEAH box helicase family protein [Phocaeicola massiliensis]MCM1706455.1 DEAD/DEAH box helicase family protein [Phocaeicola massiliensis]